MKETKFNDVLLKIKEIAFFFKKNSIILRLIGLVL